MAPSSYIGIELNPDYVEMASDRIAEAEMKVKAPKQANLLQLERAI